MDFVDSKYEFNAPQYVDFNEVDDTTIDQWFDEHPGHEGGIRLSMMPFVEEPSNFESVTKALSAALSANSVELNSNQSQAQASQPIQPEDHDKGKAENNMHIDASGENCGIQEVEHQDPYKEKDNVQIVCGDTENTQRNLTNIVTSWNDGTSTAETQIKKMERKPMTRSRSVEKPKMLKRKSSTERKTKDDHDFNDSHSKKSRMEIKKPMMRIPRSPTVLRRDLEKKQHAVPSTEESELQLVRKLKSEADKMKKRSVQSFKKAMASGPYMPTRSRVEVTHPVDFNFATDDRVKPKTMTLRSDSDKAFETQLRHHPPSPSFKNRKVTKPVPFHFAAKEMEKKEAPKTKWESIATAVNKFLTKTPDRFRTHSKMKAEQPVSLIKVEPKLTEPKTPCLTTKTRKRSTNVTSYQEEEDKLVEEMKQYKFKARKLNPKLIESGTVLGLPQKKEHPKTELKPFEFQSDNRLEIRHKKEEKEEAADDQRNHEVKKQTRSACSKTAKEKFTVPEPFSFEQRDKQVLQRKEQKIKEIYEEEQRMREFHAQPLPSLSPDLVIHHDHKKTELKPFNLESERRHMLSEQKWNEQVNRQFEDEKAKQIFKAKPSHVTRKAPFQPLKGQIPATEFDSFKLNTEERAAKREEFDAKIKEYQMLTMQEMEERRRMEEQRALKEVAHMRQQAVHKANPIRKYKEVEVAGSEKPLTVPHTPCLETRKRSKKGIRV